ncbi:O-methyltransferase [Neotamlana laminarinivorans]|uniref:Class I SAM-dependent methyltransferase n=1 Tax=Neotamlana laminarinivorans TaxID=2883124 RepID=A0A9X1I1F8_9FLAO|nr:class I SAM-dependent methyltransferase [Tamlana laminarinivorans]MCB4799681.1 class I SAM-dependent methyltransferase [Tamlana laminarinivorans]
MHQIKQYIKFLFRSTNQHGVHSPFVYNLVTQCFYNKTKYTDYKTILNYRKALLKNSNILNVTDFGAGSHTFKTSERKISEMAKYAGSTLKRAKLLYRICKYFKPDNILEIGTSLGISTHAMSLGNSKAKITSLEGCPNISQFTSNLLNNNNVNIVTGNFSETLKTQDNKPFDLVFFDGNHQKEATLNYFKTLLETAHNNSIFIFDDIYWSKDMAKAWEIIKQHPKVTVTIDTFFWGFVFFRKEQVKQHFTIRL